MPRLDPDAATVIGTRIRGLRTERLRVTQTELQEMSGIEVAAIRRYEAGKALPSLGVVVRLAFALGVDPGELIRGLRPADLPEHPGVAVPSRFGAERRHRIGA